MSDNKFAKDLVMVLFGNVVVVLSSMLTGLIIPKLLGVTNYGYYKIFTLYLTYAALLHFGFTDGILLMHGGESYNSLDKKKFIGNTKFFFAFQGTISILIITFAFAFLKNEYLYIFFMLGIDSMVTNITTYYQFISQATMRFKELTIRKILQACLKIFVILLFWIFIRAGVIANVSFYLYILSIVLIDVILLVWYVYTYKDITFGNSNFLKTNKKSIEKYFRLGIVLTFAYQVSNLIFSLDRQFVSIFFDTNTYGVYSFAYSLITIITTVVNTVSTVLFPNLKRKSEEQILIDYEPSLGLVSIVVFAAMVGYYPLCAFIRWFLPDYVFSLQYFKVLFPGIAISSCITVIIFNYYKVLNKSHIFFVISIMILGVSVFLNWIAYVIYRTPIYISIASIITLILWYIVSQCYFIKHYNVKWMKNFAYIIANMTVFYLVVFNSRSETLGFFIYLVLYIIITCIFYGHLITENIRRLLN